MKPRHYFLLFSLLISAHVTGCASHRPAPSVAVPTYSLHTVPDSTSRHNLMPQKDHSEKPGLIARIFHSEQVKQEIKKTSNSRYFINPTSVPKKCKGCQFTIITGNDNKVSQATIGKNKAAAVVNSDSATQQIATNAVAGKGNTATQTATTKQAAGPLAVLAQNLTGWIPWVIGGALVLAVVFRKRLPVVGPFFS